MTIYLVCHPSGTGTFFCPDQPTVDIATARGLHGNFVIGDQAQAEALLAEHQKEFLASEECAQHISVQKVIYKDPLGNPYWGVCDLSQEVENHDVEYMVFDSGNVKHVPITGLDNAKAQYTNAQNTMVKHYFLDVVIPMDTLPGGHK
jgi:hypothetical protein